MFRAVLIVAIALFASLSYGPVYGADMRATALEQRAFEARHALFRVVCAATAQSELQIGPEVANKRCACTIREAAKHLELSEFESCMALAAPRPDNWSSRTLHVPMMKCEKAMGRIEPYMELVCGRTRKYGLSPDDFPDPPFPRKISFPR